MKAKREPGGLPYKNTEASSMKHPNWFKSWGWIYRPISAVGWLAVVLTLLFLVNTFLAIDSHSHSVSDTLYGIFPYWVPGLGILNWIAGRTSEKAA